MRILTDRIIVDNLHLKQIAGDSSETKPSGLCDGSAFIETDTGKVYVYSEKDSQWNEFGASGS